MKQHTPEWDQARLGRATASQAEHWMSELRTKPGEPTAGRRAYLATLVLQRIGGVLVPGHQTEAMRYGIETEAEARHAYAFEKNVDVVEVGFINHPRIKQAGASPDGYVGDDGLVEFKCPQPWNHMETLLRGTIALRYRYQMQFQMACTGRAWCDFVSYCNQFPEPMRLSITRVKRDEEVITPLEKECMRFLSEVDDTVQALCRRYALAQAGVELLERAPRAPSESVSPPTRLPEGSGPRNDAGAMLQ
jgi:putative phage-type endonuclease